MATLFTQLLEGKNSVQALNEFLMRKLARPVAKQDLEYTIVQLEGTGGYQCTLAMNCMEDLQFAGEILENARDAKMSAADQVLLYFAEEIGTMSAGGKKKKGAKRTAEVAGFTDQPISIGSELAGILSTAVAGNAQPGTSSADSDHSHINNKSELNNFYSKIIRRVINKGEVNYATNAVECGGWQSQLQLPGLPEPLSETVWAGEVCGKKQDAEQSVAGVALDTLKSDPVLAAIFSEPSKPSGSFSGKGKGKSKGKSKGKKSHNSSNQSQLAAAAQDSALWNETFAAALAASGLAEPTTFSQVMQTRFQPF